MATTGDQRVADAAQRAYGILWRDPSTSMFSRCARKELFDALSHEEKRAGIAWAIAAYGPMRESEMIAADIRVGMFPSRSTEVQGATQGPQPPLPDHQS